MPVYLLHGFRWPREGFTGIRVHAIVHNLEDCSVEYIQNESSRDEILGSFRKSYEDIMKELEAGGRQIDFIEQYDPEDLTSDVAVSQPYAYVADRVVELAGTSLGPGHGLTLIRSRSQSPDQSRSTTGKRSATNTQSQAQTASTAATATVTSTTPGKEPTEPAKPTSPLLSVNVEDVIATGPGLTSQAWEALADLRDKIASGEKIGWWVVYNGDPERAFENNNDDDDDDEYDNESNENIDEKEMGRSTPTQSSIPSSATTTTTTRSQLPHSVSSTEKQKQPIPPSKTPPGNLPPPVPPKSPTTPNSAADKVTPIRNKDELVLPSPKNEKIPEPAKAKEVAKSGGFRKKFFGKKA